jgi:ribosome-binding protein aMBF1 (putative translation factor)
MKKKFKTRKKISDATQILDRMMRHDPKMVRLVEEARTNAKVAQLIYDARTEAGLTQAQLAELVGTTQSVIARLEDADYEGRSLTMLNRIASVLARRVEVRFIPVPRLQSA